MKSKEIIYAYAQDAEECAKQKALCQRDGFTPVVYGKVRMVGNKECRYEVRGINE